MTDWLSSSRAIPSWLRVIIEKLNHGDQFGRVRFMSGHIWLEWNFWPPFKAYLCGRSPKADFQLGTPDVQSANRPPHPICDFCITEPLSDKLTDHLRIYFSHGTSIRFDGPFDRINQHFCWKWLTQKRDAACSNGLDFDHCIVVPAHKNDGEFETVCRQLACQFHTGKVAELNINKEAPRLSFRRTGKKSLS